MRKAIIRAIAVLAFGASSALAASAALAEDWPLVGGDYWEVTGIDIKDGGGWKYASWLATEWKKNLEFSKSQGWIKDYMILANVHNRSDEADIYLIRVREDIPSGAEGEKRQKAYMEWQTKTNEELVGESGNRAEYREVKSTSLLQVLNFRN
jgi:hypothetical protein